MRTFNLRHFEGKVVVSGTIINFYVRDRHRHGRLLTSFLLFGCLNVLPVLHGQELASSTSDTAKSRAPSNQQSNVSSIFFCVQHAPSVKIPTTEPDESTNLWKRIRAGFQVPLPGGEPAKHVEWHEQWFLRNPKDIERMFARVRLHMFDIVEAVENEGLPMELALVPVLEAEFPPMAQPSTSPNHLWGWGTIEPSIRRFYLKPQMFSAEGRSGKDVTKAALRYLKELQIRYGGDFQLALAAYSGGEGRIDSEVRKAKARGLNGRFEDLRLDIETAHYVPRLLALAKLVSASVDSGNTEGITLPPMVIAK